MTRPDVEERARELRRLRVPYVHARVVLAERPTSAKPGDEALVLGDGTMVGFVGGSCGESTVRSQSLVLLESGESLLLRISPVPEAEQTGKVTVVNECLSGGTFEVFLQPEIPAPVVCVVGDTPIARALADLGADLGYEVRGYGTTDLTGVSAVVVASHGRDDEQGPLEAALRADVPYVALVGSRRRGAGVVAALDVTPEQRARVRSPAGLDIGARSAAEIALSILAEIVSVRPHASGRVVGSDAAMAPVSTAIDPVCGMTVATVEASLHHDLQRDGVDSERFWFCGNGCLLAFVADPGSYLTV
ncbi:MAG TPA: XdhC family protein [Candidatus Nanopelagicales bacterium]